MKTLFRCFIFSLVFALSLTACQKQREKQAGPPDKVTIAYTREEFLRRNILDTYPDNARTTGTQRLAKLQQGEALRFERPMKRPDGGLTTVEACTWKDSDGNLQAIVRDITDRKQAEEALQQRAEALLASNEELELFNLAATGRELRMIELKQEINELCRRLGEPPRHAMDQLEADSGKQS